MLVIRDLKNLHRENKNIILTIGNFDGIHLGHQRLIKKIKEISVKKNKKSAVLTLEPHPSKILSEYKNYDIRITSFSQKVKFLRKFDIDILFLLKFNQNLLSLSAEHFIEHILIKKLEINHLIIGHDFLFGKNKSGDINTLEKFSKIYNFALEKIDALKDNKNHIFSSTNIRNFIRLGKIKEANEILGYNYQIEGRVIRGNNLGKKIGFKTANIKIRKGFLKPKYGVYKTITVIDNESFLSITNFGMRPTFDGNSELLETHIFDFDRNIYEKKITVKFISFIRDEKRFDSIEKLKLQIEEDIKISFNK